MVQQSMLDTCLRTRRTGSDLGSCYVFMRWQGLKVQWLTAVFALLVLPLAIEVHVQMTFCTPSMVDFHQ